MQVNLMESCSWSPEENIIWSNYIYGQGIDPFELIILKLLGGGLIVKSSIDDSERLNLFVRYNPSSEFIAKIISDKLLNADGAKFLDAQAEAGSEEAARPVGGLADFIVSIPVGLKDDVHAQHYAKINDDYVHSINSRGAFTKAFSTIGRNKLGGGVLGDYSKGRQGERVEVRARRGDQKYVIHSDGVKYTKAGAIADKVKRVPHFSTVEEKLECTKAQSVGWFWPKSLSGYYRVSTKIPLAMMVWPRSTIPAACIRRITDHQYRLPSSKNLGRTYASFSRGLEVSGQLFQAKALRQWYLDEGALFESIDEMEDKLGEGRGRTCPRIEVLAHLPLIGRPAIGVFGKTYYLSAVLMAELERYVKASHQFSGENPFPAILHTPVKKIAGSFVAQAVSRVGISVLQGASSCLAASSFIGHSAKNIFLLLAVRRWFLPALVNSKVDQKMMDDASLFMEQKPAAWTDLQAIALALISSKVVGVELVSKDLGLDSLGSIDELMSCCCLIRVGIDFNSPNEGNAWVKQLVAHKNSQGYTLFHTAVREGDLHLLKTLFALASDNDGQELLLTHASRDKQNALVLAVESGVCKGVEFVFTHIQVKLLKRILGSDSFSTVFRLCKTSEASEMILLKMAGLGLATESHFFSHLEKFSISDKVFERLIMTVGDVHFLDRFADCSAKIYYPLLLKAGCSSVQLRRAGLTIDRLIMIEGMYEGVLFHSSAKGGDVHQLRVLFDLAVNPAEQEVFLHYSLFAAVSAGQYESVKFLLDNTPVALAKDLLQHALGGPKVQLYHLACDRFSDCCGVDHERLKDGYQKSAEVLFLKMVELGTAEGFHLTQHRKLLALSEEFLDSLIKEKKLALALFQTALQEKNVLLLNRLVVRAPNLASSLLFEACEKNEAANVSMIINSSSHVSRLKKELMGHAGYRCIFSAAEKRYRNVLGILLKNLNVAEINPEMLIKIVHITRENHVLARNECMDWLRLINKSRSEPKSDKFTHAHQVLSMLVVFYPHLQLDIVAQLAHSLSELKATKRWDLLSYFASGGVVSAAHLRVSKLLTAPCVDAAEASVAFSDEDYPVVADVLIKQPRKRGSLIKILKSGQLQALHAAVNKVIHLETESVPKLFSQAARRVSEAKKIIRLLEAEQAKSEEPKAGTSAPPRNTF